MKKIFVTLLSVCMLTFAASAQNAESKDQAKAAKAAEKEAKAKYKALQTENIEKALKEVGVNDKEVTAFKEILQDASAKGNVVKKNEALSADEKAAQLKAISEEKNEKLKELIGADRYKSFNKIRKEQKVAEEEIIAAYRQ